MKDNNTRRYKLKKDTPESKAGDEYIYTISNGSYAYFKDGNPNSKHWYFVENVENNFEWFEEIKSEPTKEKERLKVEFSENKINTEDFRAQTTANSSGVLVKHWKQFGWQYKVNTGKNHIPEDKFPAIKEAIEKVINGDIDETLPKNIEAEYYKTLKELEVTEQLLEDRQRLLDAIPECPIHGKCIPYALEWIEKYKKDPSYTKFQVDTIREETWNAARKGDTYFHNARTGSPTGVQNFQYSTFEEYRKSLPEKQSNPIPHTPTSNDKPVLFTTEDGFPVPQGYNGDIWRVFIVPHSYEEWEPYLLGMPQFINSKEEKYFNLKSNAEQYILERKPCLSLAEVQDALLNFNNWDKAINGNCPNTDKINSELEEKIKQKLNL